MGNFAEQAVKQFHELAEPQVPTRLQESAFTEGYWAERYEVVSSILGDIALTDREKVDHILFTEAYSPDKKAAERYYGMQRVALDAVLLDQSIAGDEKLQTLLQLEGGKTTPGGFMSHMDAIRFLLEHTRKEARDGLMLRLTYTDRERGSGGIRKFVSATPYKFDTDRLPRYVFQRSGNEKKPGRYLSEDSGLHFRYTHDVLSWQREQEAPEEPTTKVYGIYTSEEDRTEWFPYASGWSSSEYPDRGSAVLWGQDSIQEFIQRMLTHGGHRLAKIKQDVAGYPGFGFIEAIEPKVADGSDQLDIAQQP